MAQEWAVNFYHSRQWAQVRDYIMKRDHYSCVKCGRPAQEVHHIKHLTRENIWDPKITLNPDNLEALCRDCHFRQHQIDEGKTMCEKGFEFDESGQLVPSRTRNIFIPPG
jgi:5-methylcytosine-specific restriction endonuclease McrA